MKDANVTWDDANLDTFLENPVGFIHGTKMFVNLPNEPDRQNVVAYLNTLKKWDDRRCAARNDYDACRYCDRSDATSPIAWDLGLHTGQTAVLKYSRQLMQAILRGRLPIGEVVNIKVIWLDSAPGGCRNSTLGTEQIRHRPAWGGAQDPVSLSPSCPQKRGTQSLPWHEQGAAETVTMALDPRSRGWAERWILPALTRIYHRSAVDGPNTGMRITP
jgi:hypothetical protein